MREIEEIGTCPKCGCSIIMFKTSNYKRFAKCEVCGTSYPLPKRGHIDYSGLECPKSHFPILIIQNSKRSKKRNPAYFWADQPCFNCIDYDQCREVKNLEEEFREDEIFGF